MTFTISNDGAQRQFDFILRGNTCSLHTQTLSIQRSYSRYTAFLTVCRYWKMTVFAFFCNYTDYLRSQWYKLNVCVAHSSTQFLKRQKHFNSIPVIADSSQSACFHPHQSGQMRTSHWVKKKKKRERERERESKNIIQTCWKQKIHIWTELCGLVNKSMTLHLKRKTLRTGLLCKYSTQNLLSST